MDGDPFALAEQLDGSLDARLDLLAREGPEEGVIVAIDLDMIVETGTPDPPFGEDFTFRRQRLERRTVDLLEQLPAPDDRSDRPAIRRLPHSPWPDCRRPRGQRSTMRTAASTFALSRGRRGLVGSTELP